MRDDRGDETKSARHWLNEEKVEKWKEKEKQKHYWDIVRRDKDGHTL